MIVPDASIVVDVLLGVDRERLSARLFGPGETLHAPHLLDVEVASALRRRVLRRELSADFGHVALALLSQVPLARYPHEFLLPRMWDLRANLTAYDAAYVALAEGLDATLVTRDPKLASAPGHNASIEVL